MPSRTKAGLNLADRNSYVRVEENINDNLLKIDDDVDGTWGGLYGGYIQDETTTKEVGKRYIDEFNKKAYICIKPSNVNTEDAYTECNVVSNLDKLQNLTFVEGERLAIINKIPPVDVLMKDPLFNLNTISGKICKIYARGVDVSMQSYIFPGNDRTFILHGKDCKPLTIYFESTGFKLFGNTTGVSWIDITEVFVK